MNKKYQVFISSTFSDLVQERQATIRTVLDLGHIPSGMEIFPAADVEQFEYIKKVVDECDYYVLIIGARSSVCLEGWLRMVAYSTCACAGVGDNAGDRSDDSDLATNRSGARKTCRQDASESSIEREPD